MNEVGWLTCEDPAAMLRWLTGTGKMGEPCQRHPAVSDRKLRLLACACLRQFERKMTVQAAARIDRAELYADGMGPEPEDWPGLLAGAHGHGVVLEPATTIGLWDTITGQANGSLAAALLRDIVGNLFRPVTLPKEWLCGCQSHWSHYPLRETCNVCGSKKVCPWLTWQNGTVPALARRMYAERDFSPEAFGVLHDALVDAGCGDEAILRHCRGEASYYQDNAVAYFYTDTSGSQLTPDYAKEAHRHNWGC